MKNTMLCSIYIFPHYSWRRWLLYFFSFFLLSSASIAQDFRISKKDSRTYLIEFRLLEFKLDSVPGHDGEFLPRFAGGVPVPQPDSNILSQCGFILILPENAEPQIRVVDFSSKTIQKTRVPYRPDSLKDVTRNRTEIISPFRVVYSGHQIMGGVPLHAFQLVPFSYDAISRSLQVFDRIVLEVKISSEIPNLFESEMGRESSSVLEKIALNYGLVQIVPRHSRSEPVQKTGSFWYDPGKTYLKVSVVKDGIYRLHVDEIATLGIDTGSIDPTNIELIYQGNPHPIYVSGEGDGLFNQGDYIEFYGMRNPGFGDYYNEYSDTSVYWLTWNENPGVRMGRRSVQPDYGSPAQVYQTTQHFEEDEIYHNGDTELEIYNSDRVSGEGWIWKRILAGEAAVFPFDLTGVVEANSDSITIKVRGITDDTVSPDHHFEIRINDLSLSDFYFDGTAEVSPGFTIPPGTLHEGANELKLISRGDTGAQIDAIYLDWFEISFAREYKASEGEVRFLPPELSQDSLITYELAPFSSDSIVVYDLTNFDRLENFLAVSNGNAYSVVFADSAWPGADYFAAEIDAVRKPDRIELDVSSDLHNVGNGADYIIITHRNFIEQAAELAAYRVQSKGMRALVVDYADVLDEFNFGMKDPMAIRAFLKHAVENWQAPAPQFVLLFGDATWDYKKNAASSVKEDFVSTYGNPVSDNRLVSINGASDIIPDLFVGRLPVGSSSEASAAVEKIKLYEETDTAPWLKNIIFLNGGITTQEQNIFRSQSDSLIARYVESPPFGGNPVRIYKQSPDRIPGELRDEIVAAIDDGAAWLSFSGHAGSSTWELMLANDDIPELHNEGRLPFITSMTCHTARFANPVLDSFGELFVREQMKGAIAFLGTSGWGYILQDGVLLDYLFNQALKNGITTLGEVTTLAKLHLWTVLGFSQINISTIDQYTLLGDPALVLKRANMPDPAFQENPISVSPTEPSQSDSLLTVNLSLFNHGLFLEDSLAIKLTLSSDRNPFDIVEGSYYVDEIGYHRDLVVTLNTHGLTGSVVLTAELDPENTVSELNEQNNHAEIDFYIFSSSISLLTPINNAVINTVNPELRVYSPEASNSTRLYHFELDTVGTFDSPFILRSDPRPERPVLVGWQVVEDLEAGVYFWRSRFEEEMQFGNWVYGRFSIDTGPTAFVWRQDPGTGFGDELPPELSAEGDAIRLAADSLSGGYQTFGSLVSEEIGPGISWDTIELRISDDDPAVSRLLHVEAYDRFNKSWEPFQESDQSFISLSGLDGNRFSMIRMTLDLMTQDSLVSPEFYAWQVAYQPASDLATHPDLIVIQPDSVLHGREALLSVTLRNVGLASAFSVPVRLELRNENSEWDSLAQAELDSISPVDSAVVSFPLSINDYPGDRRLRVRIDPFDAITELNEFNNEYERTLFVARDTTGPVVRIEFDEREVLRGDYVSTNAEITIRVNDNSPLAISDTGLVRIILDSRMQSYASNPNTLTFIPGSSEPNQGAETLVVYRPVLMSGDHVLEVMARDASMNTGYGRAEFRVETSLTLRDVMNVPNPFSRQTHVTYVLTQPADGVDLAVYTIAGRKILDIRGLPGNPGFNSFELEGRDNDGDRIANGVYLYRLRATTAGEEATAIEKFIIMR